MCFEELFQRRFLLFCSYLPTSIFSWACRQEFRWGRGLSGIRPSRWGLSRLPSMPNKLNFHIVICCVNSNYRSLWCFSAPETALELPRKPIHPRLRQEPFRFLLLSGLKPLDGHLVVVYRKSFNNASILTLVLFQGPLHNRPNLPWHNDYLHPDSVVLTGFWLKERLKQNLGFDRRRQVLLSEGNHISVYLV